MKLRLSRKKVLFGAIALGALALAAVISVPFFTTPTALDDLLSSTGLAALLGQPAPGLPVTLKIPKINLTTALEYVSLTSDGTLGVPKDITHAAWFSLGPRPGQGGNAIIDGHYGWKNGKPAIFNNLSTLKPGDKIYIQDASGATVTFAVREIRIYGKDEDASGVFGLSDGGAHLALITCEGTWIGALKTYSNRLIVFADKQ